MAGELIDVGIPQEDWHRMSADAFKLEGASTALALLLQLCDVVIDYQFQGEETYRIQPRVDGELPQVLGSLYDAPTPTRGRKLARVDIDLKHCLSVHRMPRRDFFLMLSRPGELEKLMRTLQAASVRRVIQLVRAAVNDPFTQNTWKVASATGTGYEAPCATHTLKGGGTFSNASVRTLDKTNLNAEYNAALEEKGEDGEYTNREPTIAFTGATQASALGEALGTGPGAAVINRLDGKLRELIIPGLTGTLWGLSYGPVDGGLSVVFPGEVSDDMLPESLRGLELGSDGRPRVYQPREANYGKVIEIPYGCVVGVGGATWRGLRMSTGAGS